MSNRKFDIGQILDRAGAGIPPIPENHITVRQLMEEKNVSQSQAYRKLDKAVQANLLRRVKIGATVYYVLADEKETT